MARTDGVGKSRVASASLKTAVSESSDKFPTDSAVREAVILSPSIVLIHSFMLAIISQNRTFCKEKSPFRQKLTYFTALRLTTADKLYKIY